METINLTNDLPFSQIGTFSLVPHLGEEFSVSFDEVKRVETPEGSETYTPLPHAKAFTMVKEALSDVGMHVMGEFHALARSGQRYMALMPVMPQKPWGLLSDYFPVVGVRNSHDKQFAFELLVGSGIYGMENLYFSDAEAVGMRRHINLTDERLYDSISDAVFSLPVDFESQERRFEFYRDTEIPNRKTLHHLIFEIYEEGIIPPTFMPKVKDAWMNPPHKTMNKYGDSVWKLLNAVLFARREKYVFFQPNRNEELSEMLDAFAGYKPDLFVPTS
ncbi:hypothetical protein [Salinibacter phage M8CRM-1]|uniref:Uncharacterized protein n=3 Tax=Kryptosalinivirus TaxID=2560163 RepID=A0A2I6UGC2_9CAUD|nr:hypothetical protein FGG63_gp52 [Salinibacter phage M8CC-19]YP_009639520.1 hypothetical protein FGG67_gp54 [Salinibacter phage M8CRM-1]AUO78966.1 hypothetical protein [Salinibacter phage M8CC-19]AUO79125.1 hypothetical protein [Salinibacter phage M8CRM-1]AUO79200.1 hypothetical protein [Salinibacter phage M31CC-1]